LTFCNDNKSKCQTVVDNQTGQVVSLADIGPSQEPGDCVAVKITFLGPFLPDLSTSGKPTGAISWCMHLEYSPTCEPNWMRVKYWHRGIFCWFVHVVCAVRIFSHPWTELDTRKPFTSGNIFAGAISRCIHLEYSPMWELNRIRI